MLSEEEARKILMERLAAQPKVQFSQEAIEAAILRLMGLDPPSEQPEVTEEPKPSPMITHTHGLHEKYFPDG